MKISTLKLALAAILVASMVPLAACNDDNPTSPTQPGPPVTNPPPDPGPDPDPPPPPPPPDDDDDVTVSVTGEVVNLVRSGEGDLDVSFRIDDFTIARVSANTPVVSGGVTGDTTHIRSGQTVTVDGRRDGEFLDATRVTIVTDVEE